MTADPNSLAALAPGDRIEALRRRMASIPARTDGAAAPAVPTEHSEARFETRPETITESATSVLEVPPALADLLPRGGLARGSVVSVDGASSVLLSLLASVTGSGKHAAIIGLPKLGLLAATEMGADLARCALIPAPGSAAIDVAAILLDGMDLVVLGLAGAAVPPTRARAVVARARSKGACLVVTEGRWDGADIHIASHVAEYMGIGQGYGRITGFSVDVEVSGRGIRPRSGRFDLSAADGAVGWTAPAPGEAASLPLSQAL
ncbi:hypothetical protein [Rhodococcus sp. 1139]|uniref:hypothetical protein n=1 Tax=Rhodococcus sp. 1139 TaxID=1833762 RepID=UPI000872727B|nr:hypothetical protein [Rhodococcus sp. 1139]OFE10324.1 hypothetical protein A5N83_03120 [Rhodococcus sp. 1139]